ncbi:MAG: OmpA family protein [Nitrospiraceae bacterium]|nr:OmpA family protein [Nitrospiraceae bacterium]
MNRLGWFPLLCIMTAGCSAGPASTQSTGMPVPQERPVARSATDLKLMALQEEREQLLVTLGEFHDRIGELESMLADQSGRPVGKSYDELLAAKEAELADLRKLIPERDKQAAQLVAVTASLDTARQRHATLEQQLAARDQELAAVRTQVNAITELEAARRRVSELETRTATHEMDLRALKSSGAERESLVAQLQTATSTLEKMKERIAALEHQLADREQAFTALRAGLGERDRLAIQAKGLSTDVQQSKVKISSLTGQLAEKSRELESLRGVIAERDKLLSQLNARNAELGQAKQLMNEMARQGNGKPGPPPTHPGRNPTSTTATASTTQAARSPQTGLSQTKADLIRLLANEGGPDGVLVGERGGRVTVALPSHLLFSPGEVTLKPEGIAILKRIGNVLGQRPEALVQVAGHTDNQPPSKTLRKSFPNNKALSWARAENARRALITGGLPADSTKAMGLADSHPIATNKTEEGRQKNRRVELVIAPSAMTGSATQDRQTPDGHHVAALSNADSSPTH